MLTDAETDSAGRPLRTLEFCALYRRTIRLTCPACQRERRMDAVALWWWFERKGWDDDVPGAYRRLYCAACRERDGKVVRPRAVITREPPDERQPPYPDKAAWNRLVGRYRS